MHSKDGTCYLCSKLGHDQRGTYLEEHHCLNGPNRKLAEHYGLKVYLCLYHHRHGTEAVHNNIEMKLSLCKDAQKAFIKEYPNKDFREIFGKNYLSDEEKAEVMEEELKPKSDRSGFIPLPGFEEHIMDRFTRRE